MSTTQKAISLKKDKFINTLLLHAISIKENIKRKKKTINNGLHKYNLKATQVYPEGKQFYEHMVEEIKNHFNDFNIDKNTSITSIGSCFAEHLASYIRSKNWNYLMMENSRLNVSANWGRVYTIPNLCQIVKYSLFEEFPIILEKTDLTKEKMEGWFDPLRANSIPSLSPEECRTDIIKHRKVSGNVFKKADVCVITIGQNEGWVDKENHTVWARRPPQNVMDRFPGRFNIEAFTLDYNYYQLKESIEILLKLDPGKKIIFSLSPVPSYATFFDKGVVVNSFKNKCLLRTAIQKIIEEYPQRVFYFPSFEIVLAYNPVSYRADNRHIMPNTVKNVFRILDRVFNEYGKDD